MRHRTLDEMVSYFNQQVSEMGIDQSYKMQLLGMVSAIAYGVQKPQWIPCSEKPDTDRNVFIARGEHKNMTVCIGHYEHDYKQWYEDRNWFAKCLYDGLYWCEIPLFPEPWRGEEHVPDE